MTVESGDPNFKIGTVRQALLFALVQQLPVLVLTGMLLDGGKLLRIALITTIVFWVAFVMIAFRSKMKFEDADVLLVKWSYWPLLLIVYNVNLLASVLLR